MTCLWTSRCSLLRCCLFLTVALFAPHLHAQIDRTDRSAGLGNFPRVVNLTLIDADTDQPILEFDPLDDGITLNLSTLPSRNLNLRANVLGRVGSVFFELDTTPPTSGVDDVAPYAAFGDTAGDYHAWTPAVGVYTITATPYTRAGQKGRRGATLSRIFRVIDEPQETIRINCGGDSYVDGAGQTWLADTQFVGGTTEQEDVPIDGTEDDTLYQSARVGTPFQYAIPVIGGCYRVTLHFAERQWTGPDQRWIDTMAEAALFVDDLDVWAEAGPLTALTKSFDVVVHDGFLDMDFSAGLDVAMISAIELDRMGSGLIVTPETVDFGDVHHDESSPPLPIDILNNTVYDVIISAFNLVGEHPGDFSTDAAPPYVMAPGSTLTIHATMTPTDEGQRDATLIVESNTLNSPNLVRLTGYSEPHEHKDDSIRVNAGGDLYTDGSGNDWEADQYFDGGGTFTDWGRSIEGTEDDYLYQSQRSGNVFRYHVPLPNDTYQVRLHFCELFWSSAFKRLFDVHAEGQEIYHDVDIYAEVGKYHALIKEFEIGVGDGVLDLEFIAGVDSAAVSALEIIHKEHDGHPFLHVVIEAPSWAVDYDSDGTEVVHLDGSFSHTHEPGHELTAFLWEDGHDEIGSEDIVDVPLGLGDHDITLTIFDDNAPPETLSDSVHLPVYPIDGVGGTFAKYYDGTGANLGDLIDDLPAMPDYEEVLPDGFRLATEGSRIGGSPFEFAAVVTLEGRWHSHEGTYEFLLSGGLLHRLFIDGVPITGPVFYHHADRDVELRIAVDTIDVLPAELLVSFEGGAFESINLHGVTHDQTNLAPFLNSAPDVGSAFGSEVVPLEGVGFFPASSVMVHWGDFVLTEPTIEVTPDRILVTTPPGDGTIDIWVETPNGSSNVKTFTYDDGIIPIRFDTKVLGNAHNATCGAWGPDGRLYVASSLGTIKAFTVDDDYNVTDEQTIHTFEGLTNHVILGLGFNPFDPPTPPRLYVAHSQTYANGGDCFEGFSFYTGQVSVVEGPDFSSIEALVTGLPSSNHDHEINGLAFDNSGDLFIAAGSNTNAGVRHCKMGDLPESPLAGSIVKAHITRPDFNGAIHYVETLTGAPNDDQVFGGVVDIAPGVDVEAFAFGVRNPFDLVWTTTEQLYATDNGPNYTFGRASTGPDTDGPDPQSADEVLNIVEGHYYGHPNRNLGRTDFRQNIYRHPVSDPPLFREYTAPLTTINSSLDGIDEYRATTFNSTMRGHLLAQKWNGSLFDITLTPNGLFVQNMVERPNIAAGLDVLTGPGGAILGIDHSGDLVSVAIPDDVSVVGMKAFDIFPWRAIGDGNQPFVIGGEGFGTLEDTTVTIAGRVATLTSVSSKRIHGLIPTITNSATYLRDVVVDSGGETSTLEEAFQYLVEPGKDFRTWTPKSPMPHALGNCASAVVHGIMFVVGEGAPNTLAFDAATALWKDDLAVRPFVGHHHTAHSIGGKLYLFGGLGGAEGKVQIYDPQTDAWTLGTDIPFATGAASSVLIDGLVYVAGGIVGGATTDMAAIYDPELDSWTPILSMPAGRHHAAFGTDGDKFFIFGGRGPGSGEGDELAQGFDDVMVYDPQTGLWESSADVGSTIPPLPQKRGGMGPAIYHREEFFIYGGETTPDGTGQVAGDVYDRVDVYQPSTQTWRLDTPMKTPRQGMAAVLYDGRVYVPGGGTQAGISEASTVHDLQRR